MLHLYIFYFTSSYLSASIFDKIASNLISRSHCKLLVWNVNWSSNKLNKSKLFFELKREC